MDGLKLEELEGMLAGHESLKKLRFHFHEVSAISTVVTCTCTVPIYGIHISLGPRRVANTVTTVELD